jgi:hypothetical protein
MYIHVQIMLWPHVAAVEPVSGGALVVDPERFVRAWNRLLDGTGT